MNDSSETFLEDQIGMASNLPTDSILNTFRFYLEGVLLTPVSIIGLLGNGLSIVVLSCPEMQNNFNHLLIGLASFDLLYLFISLSIFALPKLSTNYTLEILPYIMPIGYGFAHIGRVGSVLMTLSVTLERFFAVVYPLKRLRLKVVLISASIVGSILYNIPRFFELKTVDIFDAQSNATFSAVAPTDLRTNKFYVQIYVVWMKFILVEVIPYILIIVLNAIMISKIRQAMRIQKQMTSRPETIEDQKKEYNMSIVLVCIVVMFILCQSVKIIPDIFEAVTCDHGQNRQEVPCESTTAIEVIISISHLLLAVNSASNFIIYMLRGDKFRRVFIKTFFSMWTIRARQSPNLTRTATSTISTKCTQHHIRLSDNSPFKEIRTDHGGFSNVRKETVL